MRFMMFVIAFAGIIFNGCDDSREVKSAGVMRTSDRYEAIKKLCLRYEDAIVLKNTAGINSSFLGKSVLIVNTTAGRVVDVNGKRYLQGKIRTDSGEVFAALEISNELEERFNNYTYSDMISAVRIDSLSESQRIYSVSAFDGEILISSGTEKYITGILLDWEETPPLYHYEHIENQR